MTRREPLLVERGELIVVQCTLERLNNPVEHNRLKARDFELVERHGNVWCAHVGLGAVRNNWYPSNWEADFQRGFIESVTMWVDDFPRVAATLFGNEPVRHLVLDGYAGDVMERLPARSICAGCERSRCARLAGRTPGGDRELGSHREPPNGSDQGTSIGDRIAEAIARSTALGGFRELVLPATGIGTNGVYVLATSKLARQLEVLVLDGNPIRNAGAFDSRARSTRRTRAAAVPARDRSARRDRGYSSSHSEHGARALTGAC